MWHCPLKWRRAEEGPYESGPWPLLKLYHRSLLKKVTAKSKVLLYSHQLRLGNGDLSHVTSVGEVVIARAHVTVLPRLRDAETRRVAGGWSVVKLSLQVVTRVTSLVEVKIQLFGVEFFYMIDHFKGQAGTSFWFERAASFLYPAHVGAIGTWNEKGRCWFCLLRTPSLEEFYFLISETQKGLKGVTRACSVRTFVSA